MLPLLRVLPVGGVLIAILMLILALTPPDGTAPALHRATIDARGPLQDREDHPEWRQFLIMAAFRRAEAVTKLRDLPSAPTKLPEIVVPVPPAPPITITPAVASVPSTQRVASLAPAANVASEATPATAPAVAVAPAEKAPAPVIEEKPTEFASLPLPEIEAPPITITPATEPPMASTPATAEPVEPAATPLSPADVRLPKASAGKARIAVPLPTAAPAELRKVVGLPVERSMTDPAPEEVTGSTDELPGATIPVEIGETSSTELPIVLPRERPPVLRKPRRPLTRAKRPAKPQPPPRKQMGLLDVWLSRNQKAATDTQTQKAAKEAETQKPATDTQAPAAQTPAQPGQ